MMNQLNLTAEQQQQYLQLTREEQLEVHRVHEYVKQLEKEAAEDMALDKSMGITNDDDDHHYKTQSYDNTADNYKPDDDASKQDWEVYYANKYEGGEVEVIGNDIPTCDDFFEEGL